jgi:hypothetical protein
MLNECSTRKLYLHLTSTATLPEHRQYPLMVVAYPARIYSYAQGRKMTTDTIIRGLAST